MIIKDFKNGREWDSFFVNFNRKTFLSSWVWGEFRKEIGDKIYRKGVWDENELVALFCIFKIRARKGDFLLAAHSPVIKKKTEKILLEIIGEIKRVAKEEKVSFVRIAPLWSEVSSENETLKKEGFRVSPSSVFPEKSWELLLDKTEDILLSEMRKNTRYMIKKAEKSGNFEILKSKKLEDLEKFYKIYKETSLRQKFKPFSFEYIKKEFDIFSEKDEIALFLAKSNNKYVAGAIIIFWQGVGFYHHGASTDQKSVLSASYLIQWEAIKEAKRRNCQRYNFWVISPNKNPKHRWAGLTFFKKGFGGEEISYSKTRDLPLSVKYWLTYLFEKIKR